MVEINHTKPYLLATTHFTVYATCKNTTKPVKNISKEKNVFPAKMHPHSTHISTSPDSESCKIGKYQLLYTHWGVVL